MKLVSRIAGLKCPKCRSVLDFSQMYWATTKPIPLASCPGCSSKVRLGDSEDMKLVKFLLVLAPAFLLCTFVGFAVVGSVPMLNFYLESKGSYEPNFAGFLIIVACFTVPTMLFCMRIFRVEIVE